MIFERGDGDDYIFSKDEEVAEYARKFNAGEDVTELTISFLSDDISNELEGVIGSLQNRNRVILDEKSMISSRDRYTGDSYQYELERLGYVIAHCDFAGYSLDFNAGKLGERFRDYPIYTLYKKIEDIFYYVTLIHNAKKNRSYVFRFGTFTEDNFPADDSFVIY